MLPKPLVIGNWKMNGNTQLVQQVTSALREQADRYAGVEVAICPPATLLAALSSACYYDEIAVGAQNVSEYDSGAHTGELSMTQFREFAVQYVLVGHSERRQFYGDDDARVAAKTSAVIAAGAKAVVCVGETNEQRQQGATKQVVAEQLRYALQDLPQIGPSQLVIAYEPVWAIGTGETATPEQAQDVHAFIRAELKKFKITDADLIPLLYGGSVKPDNAASLFAEQDIDGGLIGGASLAADDFIAICQAARPA